MIHLYITVYHKCEVKLKMWVMNLGKAVEIPKLNEAMAIELGATLLGESIIFTCGAVLVVAEVVRRNNKEAALEQARRDEIQVIVDRLRDLEIESSRQDAQLREINRLCLSLHGKNSAEKVPSIRNPSSTNVNSTPITLKGGAQGSPIPAPAAGRSSSNQQQPRSGLVLSAVESIVNIVS